MFEWIQKRKIAQIQKIIPSCSQIDRVYYGIKIKGYCIITDQKEITNKQIKQLEQIGLKFHSIFKHDDSSLEIRVKPTNDIAIIIITVGIFMAIISLMKLFS